MSLFIEIAIEVLIIVYVSIQVSEGSFLTHSIICGTVFILGTIIALFRNEDLDLTKPRRGHALSFSGFISFIIGIFLI